MQKQLKLILAGLAPLAMVGLSACSTSPAQRPQVQDISVSRSSQSQASYAVKQGDTIYGIAWQNRMDFRDLAKLNNVPPPYRLQPGQTLRLSEDAPAGSSANNQAVASSAQGGATATGLADATPEDDNPSWLLPAGEEAKSAQTDKPKTEQKVAATESNNAKDDATASSNTASMNGAQAQTGAAKSAEADKGKSTEKSASANQSTAVAGQSVSTPDRSNRTYQPATNISWTWPAEGNLVSKFSDDSKITPGIDIAGSQGSPVKAAGPGIVVYAGSGVRGYGNLIILKHNDRFLSAYAHNASLNVKENDVVKGGETIATMGKTDANQVKLHFEVRSNGQPVDPMKYLPKR